MKRAISRSSRDFVCFVRLFVHSVGGGRSVALSFVRSFIHSIGRSVGHSFIRSFVRSFIQSFGRSVGHSFIRSFVRLFIHSIGWSVGGPFVHTFVRSFNRSVGRSAIRSYVRLFVDRTSLVNNPYTVEYQFFEPPRETKIRILLFRMSRSNPRWRPVVRGLRDSGSVLFYPSESSNKSPGPLLDGPATSAHMSA